MKKLTLPKPSLAQRFMLVSLLIMLAGTLGVGNWVGQQIEANVVQQNGANTAVMVNGLSSPLLQSYSQNNILDSTSISELNSLLMNTPLGKSVDIFIVRDITGAVLFSSNPSITNISAPTPKELIATSNGNVTSKITMSETEKNSLQQYGDKLLKVLSPVRSNKTGKIFAIIEFYQEVDVLEKEIYAAKTQSWLIIGAIMLGVYILLAFFSNRFNATIERQKNELNEQVVRLGEVLDQNQILHTRIRGAAASIATLHERLLRRIGSELHDGPAQDLGLALMQIDTVIVQSENSEQGPAGLNLLTVIQTNLQNALVELRSISSGMSLPQLAGLSLSETIAHAVRAHERRTGTKVDMELKELPDPIPNPIKITIYRVIQEALNNAFHHAGGQGQQVRAYVKDETLIVQISDTGPGFNMSEAINTEFHLGLEGMRERVESLGGIFQAESHEGSGTRIQVSLNLSTMKKHHE